MLLAMVFAVSLFLSFIFKGIIENLLIVLATITFYKQIIIDKDYKYMAYALIISFISINFMITFVFRNNTNFRYIEPITEKSETLVLLVSEGEDRSYNLKEKSTELYYKEGYKTLFTGIKNLNSYKKYYERLGSSDFKSQAEEISTKLSHELGGNYTVANAYLYSEDYFEKVLEEEISKGYKNIIICPLFMTDGRDYEIFMSRYEKLNLVRYNLTNIKILDTFYEANDLALLYSQDILSKIRESEESSGILLVGLQHKNNLEQDVLFREKIKNYIEYEEKNLDIKIKLPLLENNKKDIVKSAEELLEYGIKTLYFAMPTGTIDTMYTRNLVESILKKLDMGNTKFCYITPDKKIDIIVEEIFTRISLLEQVGG